MPGSQRDRQLFHFFCVTGAHDFAGFFNGGFWTRVVLQASDNDAVTRQGLLALSSLYLGLSSPTDQPRAHAVHKEALAYYNRFFVKLRGLLATTSSPAEPQAIKTALISCGLFYCFESLLNNPQSAMTHLESGLFILNSYRRARQHSNVASQSHNDDEAMQEVERILAKLDLQATLFDGLRMPSLVLVSTKERELAPHEPPPHPFSTVTDAQYELTRLQNWLLHLLSENREYFGEPLEGIPPSVTEEKSRLLGHFALWKCRFDLFVDATSSGSPDSVSSNPSRPDSRGQQSLLIGHQIAQMLLASRLPEDPDIFSGQSNSTIENIIELSQDVLGVETGSRAATAVVDKGRRLSFTTETSLIAPLFYLAVKSSDESVCARIIELLRAFRRQEGLHDSAAVASTLEQLVAFKAHRMAESEQLSATDATGAASLEHWTGDVLDRVSGGVSGIVEALQAQRHTQVA